MCQMRTTQAQTISTIRSERPSFMEATEGSVKMFMGANTHTHTNHLGGRSATCWAHLGGSHSERDTVATHTQVPTRRKQMRLQVAFHHWCE